MARTCLVTIAVLASILANQRAVKAAPAQTAEGRGLQISIAPDKDEQSRLTIRHDRYFDV